MTPGLQTRTLENLRRGGFNDSGGSEYVTLWDRNCAGTSASLDNLSFALGVEVVSYRGDFGTDWQKLILPHRP